MNDINLHTEITKAAFELYEKSGRVEGRDLDNWLEAEQIVISRYKKEKREYKRRPFVKVISYSPYQHSGKLPDIVCKGITFDISENGLAMETDCPLKKRDILFFDPEIKINNFTAKVATVKWIREIEKDKYKVGLKIYIEVG